MDGSAWICSAGAETCLVGVHPVGRHKVNDIASIIVVLYIFIIPQSELMRQAMKGKSPLE
jgi:hypothetical protein